MAMAECLVTWSFFNKWPTFFGFWRGMGRNPQVKIGSSNKVKFYSSLFLFSTSATRIYIHY